MCDGKTSPRAFHKKNLVYIWIKSLKYFRVCFYCMSKLKFTKIY